LRPQYPLVSNPVCDPSFPSHWAHLFIAVPSQPPALVGHPMRKRVQKREDGIWFRRSQKTVSILFRAELTAGARQTRTPPEGNRTVRVFTFAGLAKEISKPKGGGTPPFLIFQIHERPEGGPDFVRSPRPIRSYLLARFIISSAFISIVPTTQRPVSFVLKSDCRCA